MPNFTDALSALDQYYKRIIDLKEDLQQLMNSNLPKPQKDEIQGQIEKQLETWERFKMNTLEELVNFPPHKVKHFAKMSDFLNGGAFDKSVFIMTKFPVDLSEELKDIALKKVIASVQDAIVEKGFIPRLALDKRFHPGLWDNVEMYLLGCRRGVAIVENKYLNELNPNVTMEWGWMRGMNRDVLYLVERTFDLERADLSGLIQDRFTWENPENEIKNAVKNWLST